MAKVALVQDVMVEFIGYMYISAVLKEAGNTVELFIASQADENKFIKELKKFDPDIVGFSILSPSINFALNLGKRVKKETKAITVYGNVHTMFNPEIIHEPGVDIVCIGEGEYPLRELCLCLDNGRPFSHIAGFWIKTPGGIVKNKMPEELVDLNQIPYHDRSLYDKYPFFRYSKYLRVALGRGCLYNCSFCSNGVLTAHFGGKRYIRKQSPERAIAELDFQIKQRKKVDFILITDEVLWIKNDWLREFLNLYKQRIAIPFIANFRFGPIGQEEIKLLSEAKAEALILAVESGDELQRQTLLNKRVKDEDIFQISEWLRKYKIKFASSVIFGLPEDTVADHVRRLGFYRKIKATYVWSAFFQPYPGLPLSTSEAVRPYLPVGREYNATLHHDMYLDLPDRDRLVNLKKVYYLCVIFPSLSRFLIWLTKFKIPLLFDLLFMCHFTFYSLTFERISLRQFLVHVKLLGIDPAIKRINNIFVSKN